jgi:hypothetical protein
LLIEGGHCKPLLYSGYRQDKDRFGKEEANRMMLLEGEALGKYCKLVEETGIDCDLHVTRAYDTCYTRGDAESLTADFEARLADYPEDLKMNDVIMTPKHEWGQRSGMKDTLFEASFPAGHLWPYKLATGCKSLLVGFIF